VTGIFGVLLGSILASRGLPSGEYALITALHSVSVMTFMFSWNALNDYMDVDIDRINRPDRPLPSGAITLDSAKRGIQAMGLLSVLSLMVAGYVSSIGEMGVENWIPALAIWVLALFLLFNYESGSRFSYKMKEKGLPGNFAISLSVGLVIIFGAASVSKPFDDRVWVVFLIGFLYNLSREIVKDIEDIDGDEGRNTFAMRIGVDGARTVAAGLLVLALAVMLAPFLPFLHIFTDWHVIFVIPALVSLMMVKPRLFASEDRAAQTLIKISMQLCLFAFLVISLIPS
jgi:geranylgeranylglycerol-phosphate geranylgeranyltransferase|tara:strand:+ start:836 stop:1693 length:858 start_codon:yes stop_codon:yes gene_type:complete